MSSECWWKKLLHERQFICIIQNEQPPGAIHEPFLDGLDDNHLVLFILLRETQQRSDGDECRDKGLTRICTPPQDSVIVLTMPVCIFEGHLGFANASQTTDRRWLRQGHLLLLHRQDNHAVLWGSADTRESLISTFVTIASLLGLSQ